MTDLRGVDLARHRFDFDLTFAVLLMRADGHVYHRYGGRDARGPDSWVSEASFRAVLETTLVEHAAWTERGAEEDGTASEGSDADLPSAKPGDAPTISASSSPLRLENVPAFAERDHGACIHCHSVFESLYRQRRADGDLRPEDPWAYPPPSRIGLDLDRVEQRRITSVDPDSPAARAGLAAGDRLLRIGATPIATASDLMHALDRVPAAGAELAVRLRRGDEERGATLALEPGWRASPPAEFAWRPIKWALEPVPGFGGTVLSGEERAAAGLADEPFAFRITYFVDQGPRAYSGWAAQGAGLARGDLVYGVGDRRAFDSMDHFHAWWRLTRRPGERVALRFVRDGERREVELVVGR